MKKNKFLQVKCGEFRATELTTQQLRDYFDSLSEEEQSKFIEKAHDKNPGFLDVAHLSKDAVKYHPQNGRWD